MVDAPGEIALSSVDTGEASAETSSLHQQQKQDEGFTAADHRCSRHHRLVRYRDEAGKGYCYQNDC